MRALVLVNIQNDFCPGGALAVHDGDRIVPIVNSLLERFNLVVAIQEWHPSDHLSFAVNHGKQPGELVQLNGIEQTLLPVHCVQDTPGAQFVPGLQTQSVEKVFQTGVHREIDNYSGFFDNDRRYPTGLADYLKQKGVIDVFIAGLATDHCVKHTALDSQRLGYRTSVIEDACRGVDRKPGDVYRAVANMQKFAIKFVKSGQV